IHERPVLDRPNRMLQGQNKAAGSQLNAVRQHGQRGAGYRWIWKETSKGMEMAFGRPDRRKPVRIGKARALDQEPILIATSACVARKIKEAESHSLCRGW